MSVPNIRHESYRNPCQPPDHKEDAGVIMAKTNAPETAFVISERNMINAFRDYIEKRILL